MISFNCLCKECNYSVKLPPRENTEKHVINQWNLFYAHVRGNHKERGVLLRTTVCPEKDCPTQYMNPVTSMVNRHVKLMHGYDPDTKLQTWFNPDDNSCISDPSFEYKCERPGCKLLPTTLEAANEHKNWHMQMDNIKDKMLDTIKVNPLNKVKFHKVICNASGCQAASGSLKNFQEHLLEHGDRNITGTITFHPKLIEARNHRTNTPELEKKYKIFCIVEGCNAVCNSVISFKKHQIDHDPEVALQGRVEFLPLDSKKRSLNKSSHSKRQRVQE